VVRTFQRPATKILVHLWPWIAQLSRDIVRRLASPTNTPSVLSLSPASTRQLLINYNSLAHCEFYLTLAAIFAPQRFNLQLFETDISDVEPRHDFVAPESRLDSKGIRVVVN
jgi:hypothetical protein